MNIAYFLTPRQEVQALFDDNTLRKGLEVMRNSTYSAMPVTTRDNIYLGTVSIADFLWYLSCGYIETEMGYLCKRYLS